MIASSASVSGADRVCRSRSTKPVHTGRHDLSINTTTFDSSRVRLSSLSWSAVNETFCPDMNA